MADRMEVKVFWQLFIHESYAIPANCKTILDCGANAGIFSVWAAKKCPEAKITALEPFPSTFAELQVNLKQNNLENRVRAVPFGLAASEGTRLIRTAGDSPDRRLVLDSTGQALAGTITVNCISLAQCLDRHQLATVDLMKMDIEGSEWEVLLSTEPSVLRRIKHIQLEYHEVAAHFGYTPEKLFAHLATAGHKLTYRDEDSNHTGIARFELAA